jgi:hypothetical protein
LRQLHLVVRRVIGRGAHNAKALQVVAQAERNQLFNLCVFRQLVHSGQRHIASGRVDVKHTGQNKLQGRAARAHHGIDAGEFARKIALDLVADQEQQRHGRHAHGHQANAQ